MKKRLLVLPLLALALIACDNSGGTETSSNDSSSNTPVTSQNNSSETPNPSTSTDAGGTSSQSTNSENTDSQTESSNNSETDKDSIEDVLKAGIALENQAVSEEQYTFEGTVTNMIGNSYYIQEGNYAFYVYNKPVEGLAIGDVVRVVSKITNYNGLVETGKDDNSSVTKVATGTPITPTEVSEFSSLTQMDQSKLITIKGLAYVSGTVSVGSSGVIQFKQGETEIEVRTDKNLDDAVETAIKEKIESITAVDTVDLEKVNVGWYNGAQLSLTSAESIVIHKGEPIAVTSISSTESSVSVEKGKTVDLSKNIVVEPGNATNKEVEFEKKDPENAKVTLTSDGKVTGVEEGTATIVAKSKADSTKTCEIEVTVTASTGQTEEVTVIYTEDFEDLTASTTYNNESPAINGKWSTTMGNVSETKPINGNKSINMRNYTSKPNVYGVLQSNESFENVTEVTFYALYLKSAAKLKVSYSTDNSTWSNEQTYTLNTTCSEPFSYTVSSEGLTVYLKFEVVYDSTPSDKSDVKVDDIVIKGFAE